MSEQPLRKHHQKLLMVAKKSGKQVEMESFREVHCKFCHLQSLSFQFIELYSVP